MTETGEPPVIDLESQITDLIERHQNQVAIASKRDIQRNDYEGMVSLLNAYETAHDTLYNIYVLEMEKQKLEIEKVKVECADEVSKNNSKYTASKTERLTSFENALKGIRPLKKFTRVGGKGKFKYTKRK